jgi:GNAT superfamily N-acetyltransferase
MAAGYALRDLDPVGDRSALEGLRRAALGPAWPLPGGLDLVRAGVVAERHAVLAGAVAIDPAGSIQLLLVDPAQQRRGVGTRLLDAALQRLGALGARTVDLGSGGEDYIWPGVPDDLPGAVGFFAARGWRWDHAVIDLVADLRAYRAPAGVHERPRRAGVAIEVAREPDRAAVLDFEAATFPHWLRWFQRLDASIVVARDSEGGWSAPCCSAVRAGRPSMRPCGARWRAPSAASASPTTPRGAASAARWWHGRPSCCGTRAPTPATSAGPSGGTSTPASGMCRGGAT